MTMQRRDFLRTVAATLAAGAQARPLHLIAQSAAPAASEILIDARGKYRPVAASPLHLGGKRSTPQGEELLRFTTLYLERSPAPGVTPCPVFPVAGEFHYARFGAEGWEDELRKMKAGGLTAVSTYVFWIMHERVEGTFDWTGRRDLRRFIQLAQKIGLDVIVRAGPYAHGEMRNGGLPDWLYAKPFAVRSNDPEYLRCTRRLYQQIAAQCRGLFYQQGGPIIAVQLENEFMAATSPWEVSEFREEPIEWIPHGSGGTEHLAHLKQLALESGLDAPIFTATAWGPGLPVGDFLPMYGGYGFEPWSQDPKTHAQPPSWSFLFADVQSQIQPDGKKGEGAGQGTVPFACCELGGGMQCFYRARFVVPPECAQGIAVTNLGSGANWLGYYMFHGGSNPAGEPIFYNEYDVPHISYDFQAPIREYGQIAPAYRMLRPIHIFLASYGAQLAPMETAVPAGSESIVPTTRDSVRCSIRTAGRSGFLFLNNYQDHVDLPARDNLRFHLSLDSGELNIPSSGTFGIAADEAAILPFNLALGPITLRYATAQLITQISGNGAQHIFFFAPRGMSSEFAIDSAHVDHCAAEGADIARESHQLIVRCPAGSSSAIHMRSGRQTIHLYLLTRQDSLRMSRHALWGAHRIVFTDADAAEVDGDLLVRSTGEARIEAHIFPAPANSAATQSAYAKVLPGAVRFQTAAPAWRGSVTIHKLADDTARVTIADSALDGVDDVLLRIHYIGDIGHAFSGGILLSDNFANGAPWEIGLRHIAAQLHDGELIIKIIPRTPETPAILDPTVPNRDRFAGKSVALIDSIEAVPVYKVHFASDGASR
jgi:hypothetical protein